MKAESAGIRLMLTLVAASAASLVLYLFGAVFNNGEQYYYLVWNLLLAWLPLIFAYFLIKYLRRAHQWSGWPGLLLTFLWLVFLPNSFYLISDYVHLFDPIQANVTYNIALLGLFAFNGLALGYLSLWAVHRELIQRGHGVLLSWSLVSLVLFISSYAIYLGRYIRLNSWDVFTNFNQVLFSMTDQAIHPKSYPAVIGVTLGFFIMLFTIYLVVWRLGRLADIIRHNEG